MILCAKVMALAGTFEAYFPSKESQKSLCGFFM